MSDIVYDAHDAVGFSNFCVVSTQLRAVCHTLQDELIFVFYFFLYKKRKERRRNAYHKFYLMDLLPQKMKVSLIQKIFKIQCSQIIMGILGTRYIIYRYDDDYNAGELQKIIIRTFVRITYL